MFMLFNILITNIVPIACIVTLATSASLSHVEDTSEQPQATIVPTVPSLSLKVASEPLLMSQRATKIQHWNEENSFLQVITFPDYRYVPAMCQ